MKRILLPIALLAVIFTSCKPDQKKDIDTSRQLTLTPDTAGLYKNNTAADVAKLTEEDTYTAPKSNKAVATKTIVKTVYVQQPAPSPVATPIPTPTPATPPVVAVPVPDPTPTTAPADGNTSTETASTSTPAAAAETKKKGISDAAKGAVIGGVGGAVAGAVIGKGGKGAIIGGVIGAAGGYIIGRGKDKKSGRVDYASS